MNGNDTFALLSAKIQRIGSQLSRRMRYISLREARERRAKGIIDPAEDRCMECHSVLTPIFRGGALIFRCKKCENKRRRKN